MIHYRHQPHSKGNGSSPCTKANDAEDVRRLSELTTAKPIAECAPGHCELYANQTATTVHRITPQHVLVVYVVDAFLFHESHFFKLSFFLTSLLFLLSLFSGLLLSLHLCFHLFHFLLDYRSVILTHSHGLESGTI